MDRRKNTVQSFLGSKVQQTSNRNTLNAEPAERGLLSWENAWCDLHVGNVTYDLKFRLNLRATLFKNILIVCKTVGS